MCRCEACRNGRSKDLVCCTNIRRVGDQGGVPDQSRRQGALLEVGRGSFVAVLEASNSHGDEEESNLYLRLTSRRVRRIANRTSASNSSHLRCSAIAPRGSNELRSGPRRNERKIRESLKQIRGFLRSKLLEPKWQPMPAQEFDREIKKFKRVTKHELPYIYIYIYIQVYIYIEPSRVLKT